MKLRALSLCLCLAWSGSAMAQQGAGGNAAPKTAAAAGGSGALKVERGARAERSRVRVRATVAVIDPSENVHDFISELRKQRGRAGAAGERPRAARELRSHGARERTGASRDGAGQGQRNAQAERSAMNDARRERREAQKAQSERARETRGNRGPQRKRTPDRSGSR